MLIKKVTRPEPMEVLTLDFYEVVDWAAEELNWSSNKREMVLETVFTTSENRSLITWNLHPNYEFFDLDIEIDMCFFEFNKLIIKEYNWDNPRLAFWIEF